MTVVFPLFHLPLVAMEHVLCMMNPYELINLSMTSAKSKRAVKTLSKTKQSFFVFFLISREPSIWIIKIHASWVFRWVSNESKTGYKEDTSHEHVFHNIDKYSENPIEEFMNCYGYIREVLKCKLLTVSFKLNFYPNQNKSIIDWIRSQQESINQMEIGNSDIEFINDLQYLLNNITVTNQVILSTKQYKRRFKIELPSNPSSLFIVNSSFIDFEQLLRLRNTSIFLRQSILTSQDINRFLKSWMACKSHLSLESFEINVSGPEAMEVIMDLPHEETADQNVVETFKKKFNKPQVQVGFDIKRNDGKVATVGYGNSALVGNFGF